jgi:hypothetical protein
MMKSRLFVVLSQIVLAILLLNQVPLDNSQRPAQVPTRAMPARIVSIASTAPKKAGSAAFVSSF